MTDHSSAAQTPSLLPCPNHWCQSGSLSVQPTSWKGRFVCVSCEDCGNHGPSASTQAEAIAAWNASMTDHSSPDQATVTEIKVRKDLDAYYYSFESTGGEDIDRILGAVAWAGKMYHHTEDWTETSDLPGLPSPAENIQNAANIAARHRQSLASAAGGGDQVTPRVVDLRLGAFEQMEEAASRSTWIPKEYFANDWISDICQFLETGEGAHPTTPEKAAEGVEREISGTAEGLPRDLRRAYVASNGNWHEVAKIALSHPAALSSPVPQGWSEAIGIVRHFASMQGRTHAQNYWIDKARNLIASLEPTPSTIGKGSGDE